MLERGTPPGVCDFAWCGDVCRRVNCALSHHLAVGSAPSVAVQKQQLQALRPPPPTTTRTTTTALHQSPQYQAAAAVEGGAAGEGRGRPGRRASHVLAKPTRPEAGAVLPPGAEWAERTAATDNTGSAIWQGRPRGGHGREENGQSSETPGGPWDVSMHPLPGRCRRPCFTVGIRHREAGTVNRAADRLRKRPGKRPYGIQEN